MINTATDSVRKKKTDEYSSLSLLGEIKGNETKSRTSSTQTKYKRVPPVDLHRVVLRYPSPLSGNADFLIIHLKALTQPPRSFEFFISAQLQTVVLVKGDPVLGGKGIAAGRS